MTDHADRLLVRLPEGGFSLESVGQPTVRVDPSGSGWRIDGVDAFEGWTLGRAGAQGGGFVLRAVGERAEAGRTMPLVGAGETNGPRFLLLDDGRLFRILRRGPRDDGFDLSGWETPGAYLTARPGPQGWMISPTVACAGIEDIRVLSILFAVEILDAEEPMHPVKR